MGYEVTNDRMRGGRVKDPGHGMSYLQGQDVPELQNTCEVQKRQNKYGDGSDKLNQYQYMQTVVTVYENANKRCKDQARSRL